METFVREDTNYSRAAIALIPRDTNLVKEQIFDCALSKLPEQLTVATMPKEAEVDPECTFVCATTAVVLTAGWVLFRVDL